MKRINLLDYKNFKDNRFEVIQDEDVYDQDYPDSGDIDEFEEDIMLYKSLAGGGREVWANPNNYLRLTGYTGYNQWNNMYRKKKRPQVSEIAYNRAIYNKRYNLLNHTTLSVDPVRVEYFVNPLEGKYPLVDGVIKDFEKEGRPKPYIEYSNGNVYYVNEMRYSEYVASRKSSRETDLMIKQQQRREKHSRKEEKRKSFGGKSILHTVLIFMLLFLCDNHVVVSQINGSNGEATGTDDLESAFIIMYYNNKEFCIIPDNDKFYYYSVKWENNIPYFVHNGVKHTHLYQVSEESPYLECWGRTGKIGCVSTYHPDTPDDQCFMSSALRVVEHSGCGIYETDRYTVVGIIYDIIYAKYASQKFNESKARNIQTAILSLCVNFPHPMVREMVTCVMHASALIYVESALNANPLYSSPPTYEHSCFTAMNVMSSFPEVLFGSKSPIPTYEVRPNAFKIGGKGFAWKKLQDDGLKYPVFNTETDYNASPKFKLSVFCRLIGDIPFVLPDFTSENVTAALKRMLGCRTSVDSEHHLRRNQDMFYYRTISSVCDMFGEKVNILDPLVDDMDEWADLPELAGDYVTRIGKRQLSSGDVREALHSKYSHFSENYYDTMVTRSHNRLNEIVEIGSWLYAEMYLSCCYFDDICESLTAVSLMPHDKKQLRLSYMVKYHTKAVNFPCIYPKAGYKFELAKYGKCGRLFVSYGDLILYTAGIGEFVKKLCSGVIGLNQVRHSGVASWSPGICASKVNVVSDTSIWEVTKAFTDMMFALRTNPVGTSYSLVFSDDTCVGTVTKRGMEFANVDISSNDTGVDVGQFSLYHKIGNLFNKTISKYALSALFAPIRVENPANVSEHLLLQPESIFMGSGCSQTTGINNIGNSLGNLVSMDMIETRYHHLGSFNLKDDFVAGFRTIGHEVTYDECRCVEDIQFLKRSPMRCDNGQYVMCLNLGAILRSFGAVENDLTALKCGLPHVVFKYLSRQQQISHFLSGVLRSYSPEPRNEILDILSDKFRTPLITACFSFSSIVSTLMSYAVSSATKSGFSHLTVDRCSILNRYNITDTEWDDFLTCLREFGPGKTMHHTVLGAIYHVDYGVPLHSV